MRILHTSDWHLGKRLMDRERLPEQAVALSDLARICEQKAVDVVLVAGDVFDTYLPPAEAEELFFHAVKELAGKDRAVVIVSGNHDDGVRLSASAPLAAEEGIYLFGSGGPFPPSSRPVRAVEAGEQYVVVENKAGERVYINALPYPIEARYREEKTEESFGERIARWIARGDAAYKGDMPHILLSHLFVAGGKTSDSERGIDLGGARAVPLSALPAEGYNALGHLHKRQTLGKNTVYSGSLLQYSFDENPDKSVYLLETKGTEISVAEKIPIEGGKRLVRLESNDFSEALSLLSRYEDCYIELTLRLTAPLTAQETAALREANEGLVSIIARVDSAESVPVAVRSSLSAEELFGAFYKENFGEEPAAELLETFLKLLKEDA